MSTDTTVDHHESFRFIRQQTVASLNIHVQEFEHTVTGAQHIHLSANNPENVFLVALRTVPHDSTGVAHILEHTALCGSQKYPVRDPFFMMTRRSMNTFMNAFTSSDWTAYPFASLNKKDFNNLLDVYLDAVFFSRLDPLDFAQEGHRLEFSDAKDTQSPLVYKGVVYNEMKGAMSSIPSQLWQALSKYMFPSTTYHFNSGGDPECIPDLSYEELIKFYQTHYHPSNAIFMTYGDISALDHQTKFENQALKEFKRLDYSIGVNDEKRYFSPIRVQESYPYNDGEVENKTHVVMGWLLGKSTNLEEALKAQLLSSVLLDNSATPLMHALETTELGTAPSPLCGLDDSQRELTFMCGLEGCKTEDADAVEELILSTLKKVAADGIPREELESALHQLELHQREVGGDSYPYGLQIILTALTAATHRGDPVKLLNVDVTLEKLREEIKSDNFIKTLAQQYLLDNPHCVRLTMTPDSKINERKEAAELVKLEQIKAHLSEEEKIAIVDQAEALKVRQEQIDDESILPKVTLKDVPKADVNQEGEVSSLKHTKLTSYTAGTNGLVYQQIIYDLPNISDELLTLFPIYNQCVTEVGVDKQSYLDVQRWQASVSGGLSAFASIRASADDIHQINSYYTFSGKALNRNQSALSELLATTIQTARFDEHGRLAELISQMRAHREQSVTGNGHALAMAAASSGICATANLNHRLSGLMGIKSIKALDDSLSENANMDTLSCKLAQLHNEIAGSNRQLLLIGEDSHLPDFRQELANIFDNPCSSTVIEKLSLTRLQEKVNQAWLTNSQVNFCAKAYATVPMSHPDAAHLVVLGGFLRNGFLHKTIREQGGAYGGGASQDNNTASFRFYSYRDPRLEETLDDFDKAVEWLVNENHSNQKLEEAILGVVSSLDKSESPAGRAKRCFHAALHGRDSEKRQQFRERVLATTLSDLKRVSETYLNPKDAHTAIITDFSQREVVEKQVSEIIEL